METAYKKIIIFSLGDLVENTTDDVTEFKFRKELLDRINQHKNILWVLITHDKDEREYMPQLKAVELFVFTYCKKAVCCHRTRNGVLDVLPHNLRKRDLMFTLDKEMATEHGMDYIDINDFLR